MLKIISQTSLGKYTVLEMSEDIPAIKFYKYLIDGKEYDPVPVYDLPRCISIIGNSNFVGKEVEFI